MASCEVSVLEKREDVNIDMDNNVHTVSVTTINQSHEAKKEYMHRKGRFVGRFKRSVNLPVSCVT